MKIVDMKIKAAAVKALAAELGTRRLLKFAAAMRREERRGEPYKDLPPPEDGKERDSRNLIGEAAILYRLMSADMGAEEAGRIIRRMITDAAVAQLKCLIPQIRREDLEGMDERERTEFFSGIVNRFPNTDWETRETGEESVSIAVTRCRLCEIFDALGMPELRNSCCAGDALYFERCQREVLFEREHTIGDGAPECDFRFSLKDK